MMQLKGDRLSRPGRQWMTRRQLAGGLLLLWALLGSGTASAHCSFINGYSMTNVTLNVPGFIAPLNADVGMVMHEYSERPPSYTVSYATCTSPGTASRTVAGTLISADPFTYATDNPAVGIRFFDVSSAHGRRYWGGGSAESATGNWSAGDDRIGVEYVALGPLATGRINSSAVATFSLDGLVIMTLKASSTTISLPGCKTSDVAVDLGESIVTDFSGPGSTTPGKAFDIELKCTSGLDGILYRIDPLTTIVSASGQSVVTLDSSSTATGVGIQLLDGNDAPFMLMTQTQLTGYDMSQGGTFLIPLKARFYRTSEKLKAGSASTALTFTITYQ